MRTVLFFMMAIAGLAGCKKETQISRTSDIKIKSIQEPTQLLSFEYSGDKVKEVNGQHFIYDNQNRLVKSRMERTDTTAVQVFGEIQQIVTMRKVVFSYIWQNNHIATIVKDTVYFSRFQNGQLTVMEEQLNVRYCIFFYKNDRIDSIAYHTATNSLTSGYRPIYRAFTYDDNGNIRQSRELIPQTYPSPENYRMVTTFDYTYDDRPNPYQILYNQLGTIIPGLERGNLSNNNVVRIEIKNDDINAFLTFRYQYNSKGLPVKMINYTNPTFTSATTFQYY